MEKEAVTLNMTLQQLLSIENPNSEIVASEKVLFAKLMLKDNMNDDYIIDMYYNNKDKFHEYITYWRKKNKETGKVRRTISTLVGKKYKYILFFVQELKNSPLCRFVGTYRKNKEYDNSTDDVVWENEECVRFDFKKMDDFESLEERVVVYWPGTNRTILQYWHYDGVLSKPENEKKVYGIENKAILPFVSFEDIYISYEQLVAIITRGNADKNDEWKSKLDIVNGIYGIVDKENGNMYIGAAYGKDGIWGRWNCYVETGGDGGNKKLKRYTEREDNERDNLTLDLKDSQKINDVNNLHWFILEIIPKTKEKDFILKREVYYKNRFCTKKQLNGN